MQYTEPRAAGTWWTLAIGGVAAILFGLAALLWPGLTLLVLVALFGAYAIVYGIVAVVGAFRAMGTGRSWWALLLAGLLSIGAGVVVFAWPGITAVVLLWVIALWALTVGTAEVIAGVFRFQWLLALSGVVSILFGLVLLANPVGGALALVTVIGIFAIVRGILLLIEAVRAPATGGTPA